MVGAGRAPGWAYTEAMWMPPHVAVIAALARKRARPRGGDDVLEPDPLSNTATPFQDGSLWTVTR